MIGTRKADPAVAICHHHPPTWLLLLTCTKMRGLCGEGKGTLWMKWEMCLKRQGEGLIRVRPAHPSSA